MSRSKSEIYLHLVWATDGRRPLVTPDIERAVYRCIEQQAVKLRCSVLAIGGMPDHVHLSEELRDSIFSEALGLLMLRDYIDRVCYFSREREEIVEWRP